MCEVPYCTETFWSAHVYFLALNAEHIGDVLVVVTGVRMQAWIQTVKARHVIHISWRQQSCPFNVAREPHL